MFSISVHDKLESLSNDNPKEYWELFDKMKDCHKNNNHDNNDCPIKHNEWIDHYLKLLGPQKYDPEREIAIRDETSRLVEQPYFSGVFYWLFPCPLTSEL